MGSIINNICTYFSSNIDKLFNRVWEKVEAAPGSARKTVEATPNVSPTTPPSLKLSAIAWYEDPSIRFAMINGIKATDVSEIEGVKVVEIKPTSVRFLHNGRYFEISMTW